MSGGTLPGLKNLVVHLLVLVDDRRGWNLVDPVLWRELEKGSNHDWSGSKSDAGTPLTSGERHGVGQVWKEVAHQDLSGEGSEHNEKEGWVVEEALEDSEVSSADLSAVDLIEDLEEHEDIEDVSEMSLLVLSISVGQLLGFSSITSWVRDQGVGSVGSVVDSSEESAKEHDETHKEDVPDGNTKDLSPDGSAQNGSLLLEWSALDHRWKWWLSGESEGCEGIHDQVDPEELDGVQRGLAEDDDAHEHDEDGAEVDGDLELQEAGHVVEDVSAPHDGSQRSLEVVVRQDDVSSLLGGRAAGAHSESNVSASECLNIVDAIASDGDALSKALEADDEQVLVGSGGSGEDSEAVSDLSEGLHVLDFGDVLVRVLRLPLHESTDSFSELGGVHHSVGLAALLWLQDAALEGNSLGSLEVVAADESDAELSVLSGVSDAGLDLWSEWVLHTEGSEEVELELSDAEGVLEGSAWGGAEAFESLDKVLEVHLDVGEGHDSEWLSGHVADVLKGLVSLVLAELDDLAADEHVAAHVNDDLWGTLDVNGNLLVSIWVLKSHGRSLLLGGEWADSADSAELSLDEQVDWDVGILEETEEADLGAVADWDVGGGVHLDSGVAVEEDGVLDALDALVGELAVEEGVLSGVLDSSSFAVELGDPHVVPGDRAGLAAADLLDTTHLLWSIELPDEQLVLVHSHDSEGEGHTDGEWKSFGDGDDHEHNYEGDVLAELADDPREGASLVVGAGSDDELDDQQQKDGGSGVETVDGELVGQVLELGLESGVVVGVQLLLLVASGRVGSDSAHQGFALTSPDQVVGSQEWVAADVGAVVVLDSGLLNAVGVSLDLGFVDLELVGFDDETVGWDSGTGIQKDDVTNHEVPDADGVSGSKLASDDGDGLILDEGLQLDESAVLDPVSERSDRDDEGGRDQDGDTLDETRESVNAARADGGEDSGTRDDPPGLVLGGLHDGFQDGSFGWQRLGVFAESRVNKCEYLIWGLYCNFANNFIILNLTYTAFLRWRSLSSPTIPV